MKFNILLLSYTSHTKNGQWLLHWRAQEKTCHPMMACVSDTHKQTHYKGQSSLSPVSVHHDKWMGNNIGRTQSTKGLADNDSKALKHRCGIKGRHWMDLGKKQVSSVSLIYIF